MYEMLVCVSCFLCLLGNVLLQNFVNALFTFLITLIHYYRVSLSILNDYKWTFGPYLKWKLSEIMANGTNDLELLSVDFPDGLNLNLKFRKKSTQLQFIGNQVLRLTYSQKIQIFSLLCILLAVTLSSKSKLGAFKK